MVQVASRFISTLLVLAMGACRSAPSEGAVGSAAPPAVQAGTQGAAPRAGFAGVAAGGAGAGAAATAGAPATARWDDVLLKRHCPAACAESMPLPCYKGEASAMGCVTQCTREWLEKYRICSRGIPELILCVDRNAGSAQRKCENDRVVESYFDACAAEVAVLNQSCGR